MHRPSSLSSYLVLKAVGHGPVVRRVVITLRVHHSVVIHAVTVVRAVVIAANNLEGLRAPEEGVVAEATHADRVHAGLSVLGDLDVVVAHCSEEGGDFSHSAITAPKMEFHSVKKAFRKSRRAGGGRGGGGRQWNERWARLRDVHVQK